MSQGVNRIIAIKGKNNIKALSSIKRVLVISPRMVNGITKGSNIQGV